jgi:hypothetical protein
MLELGGCASQKRKKEERRRLERELLHALKVWKRPVNWDLLCAYFNRYPTIYCIASVLKELKDGHLIAVDGEENITITEIGLMRLAAGMF